MSGLEQRNLWNISQIWNGLGLKTAVKLLKWPIRWGLYLQVRGALLTYIFREMDDALGQTGSTATTATALTQSPAVFVDSTRARSVSSPRSGEL